MGDRPLAVRLTTALLLKLLTAAPGAAQDGNSVEAQACGNDTVVDFVLPGRFREARKRSSERNRLLLIKGVAFGMDEAGATCATAGHW